MTYDWIAKRLRMGSWIYVCNLLRPERSKPKCTKDTNRRLCVENATIFPVLR